MPDGTRGGSVVGDDHDVQRSGSVALMWSLVDGISARDLQTLHPGPMGITADAHLCRLFMILDRASPGVTSGTKRVTSSVTANHARIDEKENCCARSVPPITRPSTVLGIESLKSRTSREDLCPSMPSASGLWRCRPWSFCRQMDGLDVEATMPRQTRQA